MTTHANTHWTITNSVRTEIDALFASYTNSTPGAALAIYREGEIVYANGYGMANLEHNVPISPISIFDIASISKQFAAMCVALLQQAGLLHVDDPVQKYLTELPQWEHPVTVRHLLHHVSGITDYLSILPLVGWRDEDQMTLNDCLKYVCRLKTLEFEPNTKYAYSNSGYVLLAILVERVSGQTMAQFARERIFTPLGMTNSHFNDDHATVIPNRAQAYRVLEDGTYRLDMMPLDDLVGDGGLFTSVADFGKWIANFSTAQVGGGELLTMMQTPGTFKDCTPMDYAWGLGVDQFHGFHRVGHSGGWAGYGSNYFRIPELGFGVAVFANFHEVGPGRVTDRIAEIVLADIFAERDRTSNTADTGDQKSEIDTNDVVQVEPRSLEGTYLQGTGESHLIIELGSDGEPCLEVRGRKSQLIRRDDNTYSNEWGYYVFIPTALEAGQGVTSLRVLFTYSGETRTFLRVPPVSDGMPAKVAGRYYSDELDTWWDISIEAGPLMVSRLRTRSQAYQQLGPDHFGTGGLMSESLRFSRDDRGEVTGFVYSDGWSRSFGFTRS
ncbi:MAG: beta-lactamase family protein [Thermomicrobiales bacterium]|nr:beta-lactamase family protein [Thermomicrobiales bacterium]MCO5223922.1 beta-lactamase family protein [Thermomicrobiales bacterium]MCO5227485.1 beta-lactamase family protein [Thermomicrobiales bacterium]